MDAGGPTMVDESMLIDSWMLDEESEPAASGSVGVIRVHRGSEFYMSTSRFHVFVDGELVEKVFWNQSVDCSVTPGTHTIYVAVQAMRGDTHEVTVKAGQLVELKIEATTSSWGAMTKAFTKPSEVWFRLVRKETGEALSAVAAKRLSVAKESAVTPPLGEVNETSDASAALTIWREKLAFLLKEEALATDAEQKFALSKKIEEAREKIRELGG